MSTNREELSKGVRTLAISLFFMFLGPGILFQAFKNKEHPLYIPVLILGLLAAGAAIYFGFRGIGRIMRALFGDK